ncbi:Adhesion and hyphal regulator 1 like protein [Verticillium longisporum]|nr:Adhesion and hyphal regulator 1 like protein [Verticillium longisporum]
MNLPSSHIPNRRSSSIGSLTPVRDLLCTPPQKAIAATAVPTKSRRVRTGCLTCRERHLKCDEGTPDCLNCRKSSRECKRGVRLNFIDVQVKKPPRLLPPTVEWSVQFQDESRQIASEYVADSSAMPTSQRTQRPLPVATVATSTQLSAVRLISIVCTQPA